jgi:hypothetical protein
MKILITTGIIFITSIGEDITTIKEQEHTVIAIAEYLMEMGSSCMMNLV